MGEYSSLYEKIRKKNLGGAAPAKASGGDYGSIYDRIRNDHVTKPANPTFAVDKKRIKDVPDNYDVNIGKSGWKKYLADQERKRTDALAAEEEKTWWEKLGGYLGEVQDTTMSMGTMPSIVESYREDTSYLQPNEDWLEDEQYVFGFLYDTMGQAAAAQYADKLNAAINEENTARYYPRNEQFPQGDYHTAYYGQIHAAYIIEPEA